MAAELEQASGVLLLDRGCGGPSVVPYQPKIGVSAVLRYISVEY